MSTNYDLKVGYGCNNNCIHCVVKPNYMKASEFRVKSELDNTEKSLNFSFKQIVSLLSTKAFSNEVKHIVITGGEPTIRKDFLQIIKFIKKNYPQITISIQTNGRKLGVFVKELYELDNNINFVVALHGSNEEIHNYIVNNKKNLEENPFNETVNSIKEVLKYYPSHLLRIETVWSKYNYKNSIQLMDFCKQLGCTSIGFSYPHMDGFWLKDPNYVLENSISFNELKSTLREILIYAKKNPEIEITCESVPLCMFAENDILAIPKNLKVDEFEPDGVEVQYPDRTNVLYYKETSFKKKNTCVKCKFNKTCAGVWFEALEAFPDDIFSPIL